MKRLMEKSRYLVLIAVVATLVAALFAFLFGAWKTGETLLEMLASHGKDPLIAVHLIELLDKFLIAAGLLVFSISMYELFVGELELPAWLRVKDLHDVKVRMSSIIVLVMVVGFLERVLQWQDPGGTLRLAIGVTLISGTLIAFSRFGEH